MEVKVGNKYRANDSKRTIFTCVEKDGMNCVIEEISKDSYYFSFNISVVELLSDFEPYYESYDIGL